MKNIIILQLLIISIISCTNSEKDSDKILSSKSRATKYKEEELSAKLFLTENNLEQYIDTAKWYLYNRYGDIKIEYLLKSDSFYANIPAAKHNQYLASLNLKIIHAEIDSSNRRLYINAFFFIDDSTSLIGNLGNDQGNLPDGIIIDIKSKSFLGFTSENMHFKKGRYDSKDFEPYTPSIKKFIDTNLSLLNPSYIDLLKRMKILQ